MRFTPTGAFSGLTWPRSSGVLTGSARFTGPQPRYLLSSATVANPIEFCQRLTGANPELVDNDGSPSAGRHVLFLNPDSSAGITSALLFIRCLQKGYRTIVFTQSRKVTELIHMWVSQMAPELQNRVSSYRAGFLPEERRVIERDMSCGRLLGVISTSALEMGIDMGGLDVCILVGYPGTMIKTWQRGGRVGRGDRESLMVLVAQPDALDQYFMRHPDRFFGTGIRIGGTRSQQPGDPQSAHSLRRGRKASGRRRPLLFQRAVSGRLQGTGTGFRAAARRWTSRCGILPENKPHRDVNLRSRRRNLYHPGHGNAAPHRQRGRLSRLQGMPSRRHLPPQGHAI